MKLSTRAVSRAVRSRGAPPIEILVGVSLEVQEGESLAILGPSGAGKTSLLRVIAGLDQPTAGEVWLDDRDATRWAPARRQIAFAFQRPALLPRRRVAANIASGLALRGGVPRSLRSRRARLAAERARLPQSLLGRRTGELSGGEERRVALARVFASDARLRLLDEPFAELDEPLREELLDVIRTEQLARPVTTLLVTHARDEAFRIADRIALLEAGRVIASGTPGELLSAPPSLRAARILFASDADFLRGEMTGGESASFVANSGSFVVAGLGSSADLAGPATLCVPAGALSITTRELSAVRARVRRVETRATGPRLVCETAGGAILHVTPGQERVEPNEEISLAIDSSRVRVFSDAARDADQRTEAVTRSRDSLREVGE